MVADRRLRRVAGSRAAVTAFGSGARARRRSAALGATRQRSAHLRLASTNNKTEPTPLPGQHNAFYLPVALPSGNTRVSDHFINNVERTEVLAIDL